MTEDIEKQIIELNKQFDKLKKKQLEIAREQMRRTGLVDLIYLSEKILGAYNLGEIHKKWADILKNFWESDSKLLMILSPRGTMKSTIVSINFVIQRILNDPNIRVFITNEKEDNAKKFLGAIRTHFQENKLLRYVYGDFTSKQKKWTEYEFTVSNRTKPLKEPTVMIGSLEKSPVSLHNDLIIEDDLQSRLNIQTKEQIDKVWQYHKDLISLVEPYHGKRIVAGTFWSYNDIYSRIIKSLTINDILNGQPATEELKRQYV